MTQVVDPLVEDTNKVVDTLRDAQVADNPCMHYGTPCTAGTEGNCVCRKRFFDNGSSRSVQTVKAMNKYECYLDYQFTCHVEAENVVGAVAQFLKAKNFNKAAESVIVKLPTIAMEKKSADRVPQTNTKTTKSGPKRKDARRVGKGR